MQTARSASASSTSAHLAIDLGASSGRAIVGLLGGKRPKIRLEEVHRFEHHPCSTPAGPVWDLTGIWLNIVEGMKAAAALCEENKVELRSIGVDTWGVDWALVGKSGELLGLPHCYRDPQNEASVKKVLKKVGGNKGLYARAGIQLMPINSIFQIAARFQKEPGLFESAERLLFMPDLFHFWLSGEMTTERTIASTSSMLALDSGEWDFELIEMLGLPKKVFGPLIDPGEKVGTIRQELADMTGLSDDVKVIAPGAHDTASAIAAVPFVGEKDPDSKANWAYISSGTWSLLGAELQESFASNESREVPFTNELGLDGTTRFLKNIAGLWLVQELRREILEQGEEISFAELAEQATAAEPFRTLINPNAPQFASPGNMAGKIREFALETEQPEPETLGDLVRCCLDSLALCYRQTVDSLESVLDTKIKVLHIVGGGTNNKLLNEITAATMERPVICGPVEATAIGNVLTQAMGCGEIANLREIREVVARSFELESYQPDDVDEDLKVPKEVLELYKQLISKG
ncbi:MAG: rhamnulokinase family protein [Mariniblastus sp.]